MSPERKSAFPDKKVRTNNLYSSVTDFLREAQTIQKDFEVGQTEATWRPQPEYPDLPIALLLGSDFHYGSLGTNYDLIDKHLKVVEDTPNVYLATNGDHIDNFNPVVHPTGMLENPLPPQMQARVFLHRLMELDKKDKIAVMGHGNHDDFGQVAGQDFYESFLSDFNAPVFTKGGILNIELGDVCYRMVLNHTYWGKSKINITNAPKRLMEYEGAGNVDIAWVGHTHESSYEQYTKGGRELVAVVSGTYKERDAWAAKKGISMSHGNPGIALMLWPDKKQIQVFKDIEVAGDFMTAFITKHELE